MTQSVPLSTFKVTGGSGSHHTQGTRVINRAWYADGDGDAAGGLLDTYSIYRISLTTEDDPPQVLDAHIPVIDLSSNAGAGSSLGVICSRGIASCEFRKQWLCCSSIYPLTRRS